MKNSEPSVYFIGAGPGDPELITVKGMKAVERADIVVYAGSLVSERVLDYAKKGAEIHNSASMNLEETTKVIIDGVKAGKKVARVHTGDPSLYGAILEQIAPLEEAGISYEIIPGVSSAFASAAYLKAELTLPEVSQTVIFTRVEGRTPVPEKERLSELAKHRATICIFLSVGMIDKVVSELLQGYPEDTPVAVVERVSWPDERAITGTLKDIAQKIKDAGIKKQAMIIVGDVLKSVVSGQGSGVRAKSKLYDKEFEHGYREKK
ncbi:MAG: precorrin-4 C(11)-methyltransferase [Deltaproteobacteria bacterium]|nr:precorrin-4 C(11)-methyltransferase [Deltaproteobacteria bacterium]